MKVGNVLNSIWDDHNNLKNVTVLVHIKFIYIYRCTIKTKLIKEY